MKGTIISLVSKICEPSPSSTRNSTEHTLLFRRNKASFRVLLMALVVQLLLSLAGVPWRISSIFLLFRIVTLSAFLLLCRSHEKLFNLIFAATASISPALFLFLQKDALFPCIAFCTTTPVFVLLISHNLVLMIITGIVQITAYLTIIMIA